MIRFWAASGYRRSASVGCALRKKSRPPVKTTDATVSKKTIEPTSGNASPSIALRNKPRRGVIGFQAKKFSNLPATL